MGASASVRGCLFDSLAEVLVDFLLESFSFGFGEFFLARSFDLHLVVVS